MILALALAAVGLLPSQDVAVDTVDLVEVNHTYDDKGAPLLAQIIFYDWCDRTNRYQVRAWRLLKPPQMLPKRNWRSGGYDLLWHDGDVLRSVHARAYLESHSQYDPEMRERDILPKNLRRPLLSQPTEVE